jgi:cell division protein FtsW (lipid II flippase)
MADTVTWPARLHHLRFTATLLSMEKLIVAILFAILFTAEMPLWLIAVFCLVAACSILHTHCNHYALMEGAGMPTVRLRI